MCFPVFHSPIRRRREEQIGLVLGSRLSGKHVQYVQESEWCGAVPNRKIISKTVRISIFQLAKRLLDGITPDPSCSQMIWKSTSLSENIILIRCAADLCSKIANDYLWTLQVLCIIEVNPNKDDLPTEAYIAVEEIREDGTPVRSTFAHVPSEMGAEEAEDVGVEHLLR